MLNGGKKFVALADVLADFDRKIERLREENKYKTKNEVEDLRKKMFFIPGIEVTDFDPEKCVTPPPARRVERVEALLEGSPIGRTVYRCGTCGIRVSKEDIFCRGCGRKME